MDANSDDAYMFVAVKQSDVERWEAERRELAVIEAQPQPTWRERLWTCPPETRLYMSELVEATGLSERTLRKYMKQVNGLPHHRLGGQIVFVAHEVRTWLEEIAVPVKP